jgi:hypothetical protein
MPPPGEGRATFTGIRHKTVTANSKEMAGVRQRGGLMEKAQEVAPGVQAA